MSRTCTHSVKPCSAIAPFPFFFLPSYKRSETKVYRYRRSPFFLSLPPLLKLASPSKVPFEIYDSRLSISRIGCYPLFLSSPTRRRLCGCHRRYVTWFTSFFFFFILREINRPASSSRRQSATLPPLFIPRYCAQCFPLPSPPSLLAVCSAA